ncbi:hypothetical protein Pcinc_036450 [Petrolisthes cinctipes]|uniref:Uncharacterized protein n=1 Tax=Petrolisthes cinctipes TaxID=88211 RepID=A0AAE1BXT8_PETCI|nr:hypothetical protein Pcinc_036450 [Petrolisthes cinctipes]
MPDTFTKFSKLFVRSYTSTSTRERSQKVPRWSLRKEGTAYAKRRTENASWLILNRIGILLLIRDTRVIGGRGCEESHCSRGGVGQDKPGAGGQHEPHLRANTRAVPQAALRASGHISSSSSSSGVAGQRRGGAAASSLLRV